MPHRQITSLDDFKDAPDIMPALTDDLKSWFGFWERKHLDGRYTHGQIYWRPDGGPGEFATQDKSGFRRAQLAEFLKWNYRVKFFWDPDWTETQKRMMQAKIEAKIVYESKEYDDLSIIGHLLKMPWLQLAGRTNCVEWVRDVLSAAEPQILQVAELRYPTPPALNHWLMLHPRIRVWGVWDGGYNERTV